MSHEEKSLPSCFTTADLRRGGGGRHSPVAGSTDFRLRAQQKHKPPLSPHYRGVGQEYWQSLSYLPSAARAESDKIKTNK